MSEHSYWTNLRRRKISRRTMLKASGRAGVGAAGLALVGCGDDDDDAAASEAPGAQEQAQQQAAEQQAEQAVEQEAAQEQAVAQAGPIRGGNFRAPAMGLGSANPPTLDPYENLSYRAQIPGGYHYSGFLSYIHGAPGVDPLNYAVVEADGFKLPEIVDDTTLVMELQDNFFWHDREPLNGRAVTMEDALFTEARFKEISPGALQWASVVESAEAIDEKHMRLNMPKPFAPIFNMLGSGEVMKFIPPEIVEDGTVAERPVGSGPFMFDSFEPDVQLTWTGNPNWHTEGLPYLDTLQMSLLSDASTILANMQGGELDASQLDGTVPTALEQVPDADFQIFGDLTFGGFWYSYAIEPYHDMRVRQAVMFAQDRAGVNAVMDSTGQAGWMSSISQLAPYYLNPKDEAAFGRNWEFHQRAAARSKQMLDAAGYPDGLDTHVWSISGIGDTWELLFATTLATLAEAGIRVKRETKEYAAYISTVFVGDFENDGEPAIRRSGP